MDTNASRRTEPSDAAVGRDHGGRIEPLRALATGAKVNEPLFFGGFTSDVPLLVGALAVDAARPPSWERHDHGDEVLVVLSGRFTMALRDAHGALTRHEATAGDVLLIPKGSAHLATLHSDTASVFFLTPRSGTREWSDGETPPEAAVASDALRRTSQGAEKANDVERIAAAHASEPYASLMRYKRWADEHLFAALLSRPGIDAEPHGVLIREVIGHFHVVDRIFQAHLLGVPHAFGGTRLEDVSTLEALCDEVAAVDAWYVDYASTVDRDALGERLTIRFTDGAEKVFTRSDVLLHVSQHGTYHRGNVGVLMRMLGMELPPDRFTDHVAACAPRG